MKLTYLHLTFSILLASSGVYGRLLFKHMYKNGDTLFNPDSDVADELVLTTETFVLFGVSYNRIFVTDRGYLSFGSSFMEVTPVSEFQSAFLHGVLVAPLWGDIYQLTAVPDLRPFHIWYRESKAKFDLRMAKKIIKKRFSACGGATFVPTEVFVVTYQRVPSYCDHEDFCYMFQTPECYEDSYYFKRDLSELRRTYREPSLTDVKERSNKPRQNGFQVALVTDGNDSYAIFNYADVEWEFCDVYSLTMFNAGDGIRYWKHPNTGKAGLGVALTTGSNAKYPGRWVYKISDAQIKDPDCNVLS